MHDMKDFPLKLKLNAAAVSLAKSLYHASLEVWGGPYVHFNELEHERKQIWIVRAAEILKTYQPAPPEGSTEPWLRVVRRVVS